jgi:hypothetical protein
LKIYAHTLMTIEDFNTKLFNYTKKYENINIGNLFFA